MPSLKSIRKRIASVKNTQKITKAMKMVAAAKLRRAQDAVQALRPYAQHLGQIASDVAEKLLNDPTVDTARAPSLVAETEGGADSAGARTVDLHDAALIQKILVGKSEERIRLVVVSADRGLAGAYNSNLFRRTERFAVDLSGQTLDLIVLGKK